MRAARLVDEFLSILAETKRWLNLQQAKELRETVTFVDPYAVILIECALLWRLIERWNMNSELLDCFTEIGKHAGLREKFREPW